MKRVPIGARVPEGLAKAVAREALRRMISQSDLIREALADKVNWSPFLPDDPTDVRQAAMHERLASERSD